MPNVTVYTLDDLQAHGKEHIYAIRKVQSDEGDCLDFLMRIAGEDGEEGWWELPGSMPVEDWSEWNGFICAGDIWSMAKEGKA